MYTSCIHTRVDVCTLVQHEEATTCTASSQLVFIQYAYQRVATYMHVPTRYGHAGEILQRVCMRIPDLECCESEIFQYLILATLVRRSLVMHTTHCILCIRESTSLISSLETLIISLPPHHAALCCGYSMHKATSTLIKQNQRLRRRPGRSYYSQSMHTTRRLQYYELVVFLVLLVSMNTRARMWCTNYAQIIICIV